jgi:hypothetical protein
MSATCLVLWIEALSTTMQLPDGIAEVERNTQNEDAFTCSACLKAKVRYRSNKCYVSAKGRLSA